MINLHQVEYEKFLEKILIDNNTWVVINSINFEECSNKLSDDIIKICNNNRILISKIRLITIRLVSKEPYSRSLREMIKDQFQFEFKKSANNVRLPYVITKLEYPTHPERLIEILENARGYCENPPNLVLDTTGLPRILSTYLYDLIIGLNKKAWGSYFHEIYVVNTPPKQVIAREGLGPFSVGGVKCVYYEDFVKSRPDSLKTSVLVFPGYEGFEAKNAIDTLVEHQTTVTVGVNCFENSFPTAINCLIGNLSVVSDALQGRVTLQYYFSEDDAYRIAIDSVERALRSCEEYPDSRHAYIVAPFGSKTSVLLGSIARYEFLNRCNELSLKKPVSTDVLLLSTSQSVSLHSLGAKSPIVFQLLLE